jgi:putative tryptophan/tyrosine transport system substrate-binding protein
MKTFIGILVCSLILVSCNNKPTNTIPTVAFADAFEDNTIAQAKKGFFDALKQKGFSDSAKTIKVLYRNAQGDIPALNQIVKYFISEKADLIGTNPSIATTTAVQQTKTIPVFMMVSPTPDRMKLTDNKGTAPANLFGVGETLDYIDTSFALIKQLIHPKGAIVKVGMLYNQSEPQSVDALAHIKELATKLGIEVKALSVSNSAEVQLVAQSLLTNNIDVFFANPDNTVFASFETIVKSCNNATVPIISSEAGLVARGAVAAYGADMYQWGFQAGEQAAIYLQTKSTKDLQWQKVSLHKHVYNAAAAKMFNITIPSTYEAIP